MDPYHHHSESTIRLTSIDMMVDRVIFNQLSRHLRMKQVQKKRSRRNRRRSSSYFLISNNISPLCSAIRAQSNLLFITTLLVILLHLSNVAQIVGGHDSIGRGESGQGIHHKHASHQHNHQHQHHNYHHKPSSAISRFTNNNRHLRHAGVNEFEDRPTLSSNETTMNNNNNEVYFKQHRLQVPEQSPILVSSSDNSYVSASPVETSTLHNNRMHHRYLSISHNNPKDELHQHHHHHNQQKHLQEARPLRRPQHRPDTHNSNNEVLDSQTKMVERGNKYIALNSYKNDRIEDDVYDQDIKHELGDRGMQTSGNDISTTATTTQRHTVQNSRTHNRGRVLRSKYISRQQLDDEDQITSSHNSTEHLEESKSGLKAQYSIKTASIIRTRESLNLGATFINYTIVTNLKACLVECWITESCDTAIYQESPVDFNDHPLESSYDPKRHSLSLNSLLSAPSPSIDSILDDRDEDFEEDDTNEIEFEGSNENSDSFSFSAASSSRLGNNKREKPIEIGFFVCYLFECAKPDGFKCQFSSHNYYVSAIKRHTLANTVAASREHTGVSHLAGILNPREEIDGQDEDGDAEVVTRSINEGIHMNTVDPQADNENDNFSSSSLNRDDVAEDSSVSYTDSRTQYGECSSNEFKCSNAKCIPKQMVCDGTIHCSDHSDELMCNKDAGQVNQNAYTIIDNERIESGLSEANEPVDLDPAHSVQQLSNVVSPYEELEKPGHDEANLNIMQGQRFGSRYSSPFGGQPSNPVETNGGFDGKSHYSHMKHGLDNHHKFNSRKLWHDSHIASIRIGQEEFEDFGQGGLNSAIIAIVIGVCATGVLIMIVGHKMKSIRSRLAHKSRRRSLVPDTDFLINTIPI